MYSFILSFSQLRFYDKQNACKSRILQTINALRQAAAALRCQQVPPLCSALLSHNLCHLLCAACASKCVCVCESVAETNPTNAQMRMCTHSMLIFLFFSLQQIRFLCTNQTENIRQMVKQERRKQGRHAGKGERKKARSRTTHTVEYAKL